MYTYVKIVYNFYVMCKKLRKFFSIVSNKVFSLQILLKPTKNRTGYHKSAVLFVYY